MQIQSWGPFAEGRNGLFEHEVLKGIAQKHSRTVAQIVLRWLVQRNVVCIPKSVHKARMEENFNIFDFALDHEDMQTIAALDTGKSCFFSHQDPAAVEMLCGLNR